MPQYRIVVQKNVSPGAKLRAPRSTDLKDVETFDVIATSLVNAVLKVNIQFGRENRSPRIVSAEEIFTLDPSEITDDEITHALTTGSPDYLTLEPDDYDGIALYMGDSFDRTVNDVAEALRESGLVPGLNLSLLMNGEGWCDYSMVEIHDTASGTYRSVGRELKHLILDRDLTGWDGILSIARALIGITASEQLL